MNMKILQFINRLLNFIRPSPRYIPLFISDVLANSESKDLIERFNDLMIYIILAEWQVI
jgi:hypothetical protein